MKVRTQGEGFHPAQEQDNLRSVVIYDDFGTPIIIVQKVEEGQIVCYRAGEDKFGEALKVLGIGLNATVSEVKPG